MPSLQPAPRPMTKTGSAKPVLFKEKSGVRLLAAGLAVVGMVPLLGLTGQGGLLTPGAVILRLGLAVGAVAVAFVLWGSRAPRGQDLPMGAALHEAEKRLIHLAAGEGQDPVWDRVAPLVAALAFMLVLLLAVWMQYNAA